MKRLVSYVLAGSLLWAAAPALAQGVTAGDDDKPLIALVGCVLRDTNTLELLFADVAGRAIPAGSCSEALTRAQRHTGRTGRNPQTGETIKIPAKRVFLGVLSVGTPDDGKPVLVWQFGDGGATDVGRPRVGVVGCDLNPAGELLSTFVDIWPDDSPVTPQPCAAVLTEMERRGFALNPVMVQPGTGDGTEDDIIWDIGGPQGFD